MYCGSGCGGLVAGPAPRLIAAAAMEKMQTIGNKRTRRIFRIGNTLCPNLKGCATIGNIGTPPHHPRKNIKNRPSLAKNERTAFAVITTVGDHLDEFGFSKIGERESSRVDSHSPESPSVCLGDSDPRRRVLGDPV